MKNPSQNMHIDYLNGELKNRLLRLSHVTNIVGLARSTIYKLISENRFPKPVKIAGGKCSGWRFSDLTQWLEVQKS